MTKTNRIAAMRTMRIVRGRKLFHQDDLSSSWEMLKRGINPPEIEPLVK